MCSFSIYSKLNPYGNSIVTWIWNCLLRFPWIWTGKVRTMHFLCSLDAQSRSDCALQFCQCMIWDIVASICDFIRAEVFFAHSNSVIFKVFICENRKLPLLCLKYCIIHHWHKNPKQFALPHSQMAHVSKHILDSNGFSFVFTRAWKILPGYVLVLLSIDYTACFTTLL